MKKLIQIAILSLVLVSCSKKEHSIEDFAYEKSFLTKDSFEMNQKGESTPFVINNELYYLVSGQTSWDSSNKGYIEIYKNNELIVRKDTSISLVSAIYDNGTLYIYGTKQWDKKENSIYLVTTKDLVNFTDEEEIYKSEKNAVIYNTSVSKVNDIYVMIYEYCKVGEVCFAFRFMQSKDMKNWEAVEGSLFKDKYVGCPTIKYHNGYYYVVYSYQLDSQKGPYCETAVIRSENLTEWSDSKVLLTPRDRNNGGGLCDSDPDFVEYNNKLEFLYIQGNQKTWHSLRRAYYNGSFDDFVKELNF